MRNIVEETYDRLINKWGSKEYKGIGTINCVPPCLLYTSDAADE